MTKVTFSLQEDKILAVDILGHAGYAEEGEDIVCAAISSAVMLTHALLYDVQHIPVDTLIEDEGAHIRFTLPNDGIVPDTLESAAAGKTKLGVAYVVNEGVRYAVVLLG